MILNCIRNILILCIIIAGGQSSFANRASAQDVPQFASEQGVFAAHKRSKETLVFQSPSKDLNKEFDVEAIEIEEEDKRHTAATILPNSQFLKAFFCSYLFLFLSLSIRRVLRSHSYTFPTFKVRYLALRVFRL